VAIDAVILDLDGVIVESEELWDAVRRDLARERGATWPADATRAMMGMSPREWSRYMHDQVGVDLAPEDIDREVVRRLMERYRASLPLLPGALGAVHALAERWPVGVASSSNRPLIDLVLSRSGLGPAVRASVSSEEVARGKPAPDVYLEVAARMGVEPSRAVAVEDSANGIRAARAAGLRVVAVPNPRFPPDPETLELAAATVPGIADVTPALVERAAAIPAER
jgi:HAD superfamily hydrolase (TIGR01509 family)